MSKIDNSKFSIEKSQCELYKIRHGSGMYYADITIDHKGATGRIQIASDYGSWQNYWGSCGCGFKKFLTQLDIHYTAGKFGANDWFDFDATIKGMKKTIKDYMEDGSLSEEEAKELLEEVKSLDDCIDIHEYYNRVYHQCHKLLSFFDAADFPCVKDVTPQFKRFWNEAWAVFIEQMKKEID